MLLYNRLFYYTINCIFIQLVNYKSRGTEILIIYGSKYNVNFENINYLFILKLLDYVFEFFLNIPPKILV